MGVDNQKYVEKLAITVEQAAKKENTREVYNTFRKLAGKCSRPEQPAKNKRDHQRMRYKGSWTGG